MRFCKWRNLPCTEDKAGKKLQNFVVIFCAIIKM